MIVPKQYIQMCRAAPELKEHKPQEGDLYALPNGVVFVVASYCFRVDNPRFSKIYLAIPSEMRPSQINGEPDFKSPVCETREYECYPMKYWTWLPSRAQLEKMVIPDYGGKEYLAFFHELYDFVYHLNHQGKNCFDSIEELEFAFVWKQEYNKTWNGKQWIEINSL
ncbi:hypothetical protein ES703_15252 [subsurface metagenome]